MPVSNINVNGLEHVNLNNELKFCYGEIDASVKSDDFISIPANINSDCAVVISSPNGDLSFRKELVKSPVISDYSVTLFDNAGCVLSKLKKNRSSNDTGDVANTMSNITFLSDLIIPRVKDDVTTCVLLDSYNLVDSVEMDSSKEFLIRCDFSRFLDKNERLKKEKTKLFLTKELYELFIGVLDLDEYFCEVHKSDNIYSYLSEYLFGKILCTTEINHRENIFFGEDTDIIYSAIESSKGSKMMGRSKSNLQLNICSLNSKFKFMVLLKCSSSDIEMKFISKPGLVVKSKFISETSLESYFENLKNMIFFWNELKVRKKVKSDYNFLLTESEKVVEYLFDKPDLIFDDDCEFTIFIKNEISKFSEGISNDLRGLMKRKSSVYSFEEFGMIKKPSLGRQYSQTCNDNDFF